MWMFLELRSDMGIHPMHAPLMAAIRTGIINVHLSDENVRFFVQGGFADVTTGELIILAEKACLIDDIDREEIKNDIEFAKESLVSSRRRSSFIHATESRWSPIRIS